jgi:hypothetical protein
MLLVTLEHRFEFPSCPGVAPPGALTATLARELTAHGKKRGVAVAPLLSLIGHCEGIGATECYAELSTDPYSQPPWGGYEQLNLELPRTRELIRSMIHDAVDAFPGEYLHVGCDEIRQLEHLFPEDAAKREQVMIEWVSFLLAEAGKTGRKLMMWGDMPNAHPALRQSLSKDVILCDWHYGPEGGRDSLERLKGEGRLVVAAPAVSTCGTYAAAADYTLANLSAMIGDAADLDLEGFLVTTWEMDFASGWGLAWPWLAIVGEIAAGRRVPDWRAFLADFAAQRYGVDGRAFVRLHELLDGELQRAVDPDHRGFLTLCRIRKHLFRSSDAFAEAVRPTPIPANRHQNLWEPSPFGVWLLLRPVLTPAVLDRLDALAREAASMAGTLSAASRRRSELEAILVLAEAMSVLAERLRLLESAKATYHQAALAQKKDTSVFHAGLAETADAMERLRPGIRTLRRAVDRLDAVEGLDAGEQKWLEVHEKSLDEHVAALRKMRADKDSLLEFGEFLRRPAHVGQRLTWR